MGSFAIEVVVGMFIEDQNPERIRLRLEERGVKFTAMIESEYIIPTH